MTGRYQTLADLRGTGCNWATSGDALVALGPDGRWRNRRGWVVPEDANGPWTPRNDDEVDFPGPKRVVPAELVSAAEVVHRYSRSSFMGEFHQGVGPLCYGEAEAQARVLREIARIAADTNAAATNLAAWLERERTQPLQSVR